MFLSKVIQENRKADLELTPSFRQSVALVDYPLEGLEGGELIHPRKDAWVGDYGKDKQVCQPFYRV